MMYFKRMALFISLIMLAVGYGVSGAQSGAWSVWLHGIGSSHMIQVDNTGQVVNDLELPIPQAFTAIEGNVAVSPDGMLMAMVVSNEDQSEYQFRLYDMPTQAVSVTYNMPQIYGHSLSLHAAQSPFSEGAASVAFGYATGAHAWSVVALDSKSGAVLGTLSSDLPAMAAFPQPEAEFAVPYVQQFLNNEVIFTLSAPYHSDQTTSFRWMLDSNTVEAEPFYTSLETDIFAPSGDVIQAAFWDGLPNNRDAFRYGNQQNVLQTLSADKTAVRTFFHSVDESLFRPRFVQNGERIVVGSFTADGQGHPYRLLERDGTLVGEFSVDLMSGLAGLTDGFVYVASPLDLSQPTRLFYVNTREADGLQNPVELWQSAGNIGLDIVWVQDRRLVSTGPFMDWADVVEPIPLAGS